MKDVGKIILAIIILVAVVCLCPLAVMVCWNACMPIIFGLPVIGFKTAFALNFLVAILLNLSITVKDRK